jgi:hypothetical protein
MRAYVLLNTKKCHCKEAAEILERQSGVTTVDLVEGPPDIVLVMEASRRLALASKLIEAMSSVENLIDGVELLPASKCGRSRPKILSGTDTRNSTGGNP